MVGQRLPRLINPPLPAAPCAAACAGASVCECVTDRYVSPKLADVLSEIIGTPTPALSENPQRRLVFGSDDDVWNAAPGRKVTV